MTETILPSADPLGEALHSLRMSGTFYCRSELTAPWGVTLPSMPDCVCFHVVTSGHCLLEVGEARDAEQLLLRTGELALVPHGRGHRARSEAHAPVPDILGLPHEYITDRYTTLRHGGGGASSTVICGAVRFEHPAARDLLKLLPAVIHIDASDSPESDWMHATLRLIAAEATALRPGGETVTTRLSDILVIQAIRSWIDSDPGAERMARCAQGPANRSCDLPDPAPAGPALDRRCPRPRSRDVTLGLRGPLHGTGWPARDGLPHPLAHASR